MIEKTDFETYLYVSKNKFQIFVFDKKKMRNLYNNEEKIFNKFNFEDFTDLSKFLDENIFKIEKLIGNFIRNIILLIEYDDNFHVNIGVKKKNYENIEEERYLKNCLIELKDLFRKNYQNYRIMHMVIDNYSLYKSKNTNLIKKTNNNYFCLELNFIIIDNHLVDALEKNLEKYQVKISQYMCGNYLKNFFQKDSLELSEMAHKIKNGINDKEVILMSKDHKNKGLFEKFFQLFS